MIKLLIEFRPVNSHVLGCLVIGNLRIEVGKFRDFNKIAKTLLLNDIVRYVELKIGRLFGEDGSPSIETADVLPFQFLGTQILEEQVQFRQAVGYGRTGEECRPQVLASALLYGAYCKEHIQGFLAPFRVSQPRHTVMPGVESQVLELVR